MDHIAEVDLPIAPDRRLKRQSQILSWLILLAFSVAVLIDVAEVSAFLFRAGSLCGVMNGGFAFVVDFPPFRETTESLPASFISVSHLAVWQSMLAGALLALRLLPGLVILGSLYLLFRTYALGRIFTHGNTAHIRRIAWALLAYAVVPLITHATLFAAGLSPVALKLEVRQVDAAVIGVILFAVAHVMSFGGAIDRDREGFV
jgi:small-conductance mechanosensitive channel